MRSEATALAAVGLGGALGSLTRWGVGLAVGGGWATMLVNVTGCFLMGVLISRYGRKAMLRAFLGTGVLGGFTTFSTASTDAVALARSGQIPLAALYAAGTLAICVGATLLGRRAGQGHPR